MLRKLKLTQKNGFLIKKNVYHVKFFKGCIPQILLGCPFLNTLSYLNSHQMKPAFQEPVTLQSKRTNMKI